MFAGSGITASITSDADSSQTTLRDFVEGYNLGWHTGYDVGIVHGAAEESAAWSSILTGCTSTWRVARRDETIASRVLSHDPCRKRCRACSRCIHSLAWWSRDGRPYEGVAAEAARLARAS